MKESVDLVFIIAVSGLFALLYALRIHVDYRLHVAGQPAGPLPVRYRGIITLHLLLAWWLHLLALSTSTETNERVLRGLAAASDWVWAQLTGIARLETIIILGLPAGIHLLATAVTSQDQSGKRMGSLLMSKFRDQIRDTAILVGVAAAIFTLILTFNTINQLMAGRLVPDLASFVHDMLVSAAMVVIVVSLLIVVMSPAILKRAIKRCGGKWEHIWSEVHGTHIKDAVWYGLIFLFVPSLLYRWAAFARGRGLSGHAPFLLTLVFLHIVGFTVGALLDWLEIRKLRTYEYRKDMYTSQWQFDQNMLFTKRKDMAILSPLVVASWAYFLWKVVLA